MQLKRAALKLSAAEAAQLQAAVARDAPMFSARLGATLGIDCIEQAWWPRQRVLELVSALPFPARRLHVLAGPGAGPMFVLSGHIEHLQALARRDPPRDIATPAQALAYANFGSAWTRIAPLGEVKIGAFAEIPWFANLDAVQTEIISELAQRFVTVIGAEQQIRIESAWCVRSWWIANRSLIERELIVPDDGVLRRHELIHAENLPLPPGNYWRLVGNRLIPVG